MAKAQFGSAFKRGNGRWSARFVHPHKPRTDTGGRNYVTPGMTFDTKAAAVAWLNRNHAAIQAGTWKDPKQEAREREEAERLAKSDAYTFADHADAFMAAANYRASTRASTLSMLRNHLLPRWGDVPLKAITRQDITQWIANDLAPNHDGARKVAFKIFSTILANAVDNELLEHSPVARKHTQMVAKIRNTQRHAARLVAPEELAAVLEVITPSNRLIVEVLAHTGMRVGELRELRRFDLNLGAGLIHVRRGVTGEGASLSVEPEPKTRAGIRDLSISPELVDKLRDHLAGQPVQGKEALVFPSPRDPGKHFNTDALRTSIAQACKRAGVEHFSPHDLRHSFATFAGRVEGISVRDVQAALGHSAPTMSLRYMKSDASQLSRIAAGVASQLDNPEDAGRVVSLDERRANSI